MSLLSMAGSSLARQLCRFSSRAGGSLPKPRQRALRELLHGIISRGSPLLSDSMRALGSGVSPKKTIERLGRHLGRSDLQEACWDALLGDLPRHLREDSIIAIDPTDVSKPHARKMEYLSRVRDGSTDRIENGFWAVAAVLARPGSSEWLPLCLELYAPAREREGKWSENLALLSVIRRIMGATGGKGTLVLDRGGDRIRLMEPLLSAGYQFTIRQRGDRHVLWRGRQMLMSEVAEKVRCRTRVMETYGGQKTLRLLGSTTVRLPDCPGTPLSLVTSRTGGRTPLMLLSTHTGWGQKHELRILSQYQARWRVEEAIRFMKQTLQWEDFRVRKWERMKTLSRLLCLAAYFLATRLGIGEGESATVRTLALASRPIFGVPEQPFWAAAAGLQELWRARGPPAYLQRAA